MKQDSNLLFLNCLFLLLAEAQQIASRQADLSKAVAQFIKAIPYRMSDDTEITLADNGILFGRWNGVKTKVVYEAVEVAIHPVPGWLQKGYLFEGPFFSFAADFGGFRIIDCHPFFWKIFLLLFLNILCYAMLCYVYQSACFRCFREKKLHLWE